MLVGSGGGDKHTQQNSSFFLTQLLKTWKLHRFVFSSSGQKNCDLHKDTEGFKITAALPGPIKLDM